MPSQDKGFSSQEAGFLGLPSDIQLVLKSKSYLRQRRKYFALGATLGGQGGVKNLDQWVGNSSSQVGDIMVIT